MREIVILHVFKDEKFFDRVSDFFDSLQSVRNLYYFYNKNNTNFKYIKKKEKIKVITSFKEYTEILKSSNIDIIYFQSLPETFYKFFRFINPKTIVIWWCFGFEIYYPVRFLSPLIKVDLYKPLTLYYKKRCTNSFSFKTFIRPIYWMFRYPWDNLRRKRILRRIDYFSPVLPIDYKRMLCVPYFRAKPFMINSGPGLFEKKEFFYFSSAQNILVGNSFTYTNNHLDIFAKLKSFQLPNQKYIVPINYGTDYNGDKETFKNKSGLIPESVIWIDDFMPLEKYKVVLSSVSHAIFGQMRQQAMGNINRCLANGTKLFLYKDSLIYKQLIDFGYVVYTIEDDLCEKALREPLSKEYALKNYSIKYNISKDRLRIAETEIIKMINNRDFAMNKD